MVSPGRRCAWASQGTANRRFYLRDAMVELLWVHDEAEARSPRTAPTTLFERSMGEGCPFGIAWSAPEGTRPPPPFATWAYRPSYLPEGVHIAVAELSQDAHQPFAFLMPGPHRPLPSGTPHSDRSVQHVGLTWPSLASPWVGVLEGRGRVLAQRGPAVLEVQVDGPALDVDLRALGVPLRLTSVG